MMGLVCVPHKIIAWNDNREKLGYIKVVITYSKGLYDINNDFRGNLTKIKLSSNHYVGGEYNFLSLTSTPHKIGTKFGVYPNTYISLNNFSKFPIEFLIKVITVDIPYKTFLWLHFKKWVMNYFPKYVIKNIVS